MTTFVGFSTVNRPKQFTLTDYELIKQDLVNAFNIRQGSLPGRPAVGTVIWDFLFENQIEELQNNINQEIQRVVAQDPRITVASLDVFPQENGILIQLQVQTVQSTTAEMLSVFFDLQQRRASYV
jgi:phage baseplate assembly protein W